MIKWFKKYILPWFISGKIETWYLNQKEFNEASQPPDKIPGSWRNSQEEGETIKGLKITLPIEKQSKIIE